MKHDGYDKYRGLMPVIIDRATYQMIVDALCYAENVVDEAVVINDDCRKAGFTKVPACNLCKCAYETSNGIVLCAANELKGLLGSIELPKGEPDVEDE